MTAAKKLILTQKSNVEPYASRIARINEAIGGRVVELNEFDVPAEPGRYLVVEHCGRERVWAISCDSLQQCATEISASDTERENVLILDLDTGDELTPILEVTKIMGGEDGIFFAATQDARHISL